MEIDKELCDEVYCRISRMIPLGCKKIFPCQYSRKNSMYVQNKKEEELAWTFKT